MKKENKQKIAIILGTRPEIIKLSPIIKECQKQKVPFFIIHSNQHYSKNMDAIFFEELKLPHPKYNLEIGSCTHGQMTGRMIEKIEEILIKEKPTWVLIQGDTNTVMSGAIAASKLQIKIGHIEAGLRSYDRTMPEEINRIITDHISNALFCPTLKQANIVKKEGINKKKVFITGNTIVDAVLQNIKLLKNYPKLDHYKKEDYFLLTTHRPSNVDNEKNLSELITTINSISKKYNYPVYFPIHPRTKKQLEIFKIKIDEKQIKLMEPVSYLEMLALEKNAKLIFTDSGGIQEEACIIKTPSLTLRKNTERPETVEVGATILVGHNKYKITSSINKMLNKKRDWKNPFGNGDSSKSIISIIRNES